MSAMNSDTPAPQVFTAALVDAVLNGQPAYPLSMPPMPPVRTNGVWMAWEDVFGPQPQIMMPIPDALRQRVLAASTQGTLLVFDPASGTTLAADESGVFRPLDGPQPDGPGPDGPQPAPSMGFYQVARVGVDVILDNLTNGPVSNSITIPFEAGYPIGTLQEVNVLVDGAAYRGATELVAPAINGGITVDTSFLENGDHTFQVQVGWLNIDMSDPNSFLIHQISDPFTLTVSNIIYYPDWVDNVSELGYAVYFARTTCTNADWQIDIYDVNTNYVQSLTGHTTDGIIEAYWDMVDTNGVTRTNIDVDPEFSSVITVGDPTSKKAPTQPVPYPYPAHGAWTISYQDTFSYMVNSNMYYNAVYMMGSLGANAGGAYTVFPSSPSNGQCFPIRYTNIHQALNFGWVRADENALLNLLTNRVMRNFYYNGHGGPNSISIFLSKDKFAQALKRQPFRFVFLDACSTANGGLAGAFGINYTGPRQLSDFQKDKSRPRAYLGYTRDVAYCENGSFIDPITGDTFPQRVRPEVTYFLTNFEFYWYFNYDLTTSIANAINDTPYVGPGWQTGEDLKLVGYSWLGLDAYNYKTDWSN